MMKQLNVIIFIIVAFFSMEMATAQTASVAGTVKAAESLEPLPGANIASQSTGIEIIADRRGYFNFPGLRASDSIIVTYIGFDAKVISVGEIGDGPLEIYLDKSLNMIDEIVVSTGYESFHRERATGSFTHIDNTLFNRSVSTDLISRLEGITNGLSFELPVSRGAPSKQPDLRIRGLSTINGETNPLIILDNFPYEGDINNINPNDVESITLLKDAAAASIWGARAGNGVIVITTKRGSTTGRPVIGANANLSIGQKPDLYYHRGMLSPADAIELEKTLFDKGVYSDREWIANTPAVEILFAQKEGIIGPEEAEAKLEELKQYDLREEALRYLYRQSLNQQYAVNVNLGTAANRHYLSLGVDDNAGNLVGDDFRRITLNSNSDFQITHNLTLGASINFIHGKNQNNGIGLFDLAPSGMIDNPYSYGRLMDADGNSLPLVKNNRLPYTDRAVEMGLLDWHYRPLDELKMNDNVSESQEVRVNTSLSYRMFNWLNAEIRYQYQTNKGDTRNHYTADSYYARNEINRFTQADGSHPIPIGGILDRRGSTFLSHYGRAQLKFGHAWTGHHEVTGLAGFELRHEAMNESGGSRLYGYNDKVRTHQANLDFDGTYPTRPRSSARIPNGVSAGNELIDRFVSYYANFSYNYDRRYVLSSSVRWDSSNIFGVSFNQKGVPLWSVGFAWNLHDEQFFRYSWFDVARFRATYGANGNTVRSLSSLPYVQYGHVNDITGLPAARLLSVGNPDLSWEQIKTTNLGFDFGFWDGRISGSIEWYHKNSSNLIGDDFFDPTSGIIWTGSSYNLERRRNYAQMESKGWDLELNAVTVRRGKFQWKTTLLLSKATNVVTDYYDKQNPLITDYFGSLGVPVVEGRSIDQLYALPWYGLDSEGSPMVMVDGTLSTDYNAYFNSLRYEDLLKIGVSRPPYFGSIRNTLAYGGFSVSFNLTFKAGYVRQRSTISYNSLFGSSRLANIDYLERWQEPGDEFRTNVPSLPESTNTRRDQAYLYNETLFEKGDHVRLQDVNFSYTVPTKYASYLGFSQLSAYGYVRNLGVLWKKMGHGIDPDVRYLYPLPLQLSFGIKVQL